MKTIYWSLPLFLLLAGCRKNSTISSNGGGNNGGGNNGGGGDSLTVSSFSPHNPYSTDEIAITGTGFNPDKTKDSVYFSTQDALNFGTGYATITQATATQLKFVMPPDSVTGFMKVFGYDDGVVDIKVMANGKSKSIPQALKFKMACQLSRISIPANVIVYPRPADTLTVIGRGWSKTGTSLSINGQPANLFNLDSSMECCGNYATYWVGYSYLPKTFFGEINNEDTTKMIPAAITNADGRTDQKMIQFYLSPIMRVDSFDLPGFTFVPSVGYKVSLSQLNGNGGVLNIRIIGKNLKSNAVIAISGTDGSSNQMGLGVSGFPDNAAVQIGTGGLKAGYTYTVLLYANNSSQGRANYAGLHFYVVN
ncbi:MAG: IPT/TIG domain-containing protein [Bacteroidota bacterium]|nr:IPT/TIG domain-containing protein [Bacteroidota bacterium]MDP4260333.1 IPT/TIG domain-containing protein [Bacteroidota bacterium]